MKVANVLLVSLPALSLFVASYNDNSAELQRLAELEEERIQVERERLAFEEEQQRLEQERLAAERAAEEERQRQIVYGERQRVEQGILAERRNLEDRYPATFATFNGCMSNAQTEDDQAGCMATALIMAQWDDGDSSTSAADFGTRYDRWKNGQRSLQQKMNSGEWSQC